MYNEHVSLREFTQADIEKKVRWINDSENNQFLHYDIPLSVEKTTEWFENRNTQMRCDLVIEYNHIPVGLIGLLNIDYIHQKAECYISMGETQYKHRGIATAAMQLLFQKAFKTDGLNKVYLNVDSDNIIACRLYEKVGMRREGLFRQDMVHQGRLIDRVRYAILYNEFMETLP